MKARGRCDIERGAALSKPGTIQIDRTRIVSEQFEDDPVLIHIKTGCYYRLSKTVSEIVHLLEVGHTVNELTAFLFDPSNDLSQLRPDIESFVERLANEEITIARSWQLAAV
jgi:hypothetical protein